MLGEKVADLARFIEDSAAGNGGSSRIEEDEILEGTTKGSCLNVEGGDLEPSHVIGDRDGSQPTPYHYLHLLRARKSDRHLRQESDRPGKLIGLAEGNVDNRIPIGLPIEGILPEPSRGPSLIPDPDQFGQDPESPARHGLLWT